MKSTSRIEEQDGSPVLVLVLEIPLAELGLTLLTTQKETHTNREKLVRLYKWYSEFIGRLKELRATDPTDQCLQAAYYAVSKAAARIRDSNDPDAAIGTSFLDHGGNLLGFDEWITQLETDPEFCTTRDMTHIWNFGARRRAALLKAWRKQRGKDVQRQEETANTKLSEDENG